MLVVCFCLKYSKLWFNEISAARKAVGDLPDFKPTLGGKGCP